MLTAVVCETTTRLTIHDKLTLPRSGRRFLEINRILHQRDAVNVHRVEEKNLNEITFNSLDDFL